MVYASTFILATAALAVAPALAAPAGHHQTHKASPHTKVPSSAVAPAPAQTLAEPSASADLDAREPNPFNFRKAFRSATRIASKVGGIAMKAAPLLLRDEDGNIYDARDFAELEEVDAREPNPFNFRKAFRSATRIASKVGGIAMKAAPLLLRDEDGNIYDARDFADLEEIDARDFDELAEIDAREPNPFNFRKAFRSATRIAGKVGGIAMKAAPLLLRDVEDLDELDARDLLDASDEGLIYVRDIDGEIYVLDAREPRFSLKRTLHKVGGVARKAIGAANKVMDVAGQFGLRELEEEMNEAREYEASLDELD
jgi:hypothetical protein